MVKRYFQAAGGSSGQGNRHAPESRVEAARFTPITRRAVAPDAEELAANPRARSAKLRAGLRTDAPAQAVDRQRLGMPQLPGQRDR